ncbi:MAG: hypothetical protein JXR68_04810 [Bacteroidales bacterium]|nr:hypothetical protein [Bacteroidales bacterium]
MKKFTVFIIALFAIHFQIFSQKDNPHPIDGWSFPIKVFMPEVSMSVSNNPAIGVSYGFIFGHIYKANNFKTIIIELKPGVDFVVYPERYVNFKFRTTLTLAIPLAIGVQYNFSSDFNKINSHSIESLIGINKYIINSNMFKFWKIFIGYDFRLGTNNTLPDYYPLKLHLVLEFRL